MHAAPAAMPPSPSKIIRRVHLYLALFLTPWMLV